MKHSILGGEGLSPLSRPLPRWGGVLPLHSSPVTPYQACWIRPLRPPKVQARFTPPVVIASAADVDDADIDDV